MNHIKETRTLTDKLWHGKLRTIVRTDKQFWVSFYKKVADVSTVSRVCYNYVYIYIYANTSDRAV